MEASDRPEWQGKLRVTYDTGLIDLRAIYRALPKAFSPGFFSRSEVIVNRRKGQVLAAPQQVAYKFDRKIKYSTLNYMFMKLINTSRSGAWLAFLYVLKCSTALLVYSVR